MRASIALPGTIILAVVPKAAKTEVSKERVRERVRARSASEALKEAIYRYPVGAPPFGPDRTPADLIKRCQTVKGKVRDLAANAAMVEPAQRERPLTLTPDEYVTKRVNEKVERCFLLKGKQNALAAKRPHDLEFGLGMPAVNPGAGAGAGASTGFVWLGVPGPWAAVTARLAASRYDHQATTCFETADRLKGLSDEWLANHKRLNPDCVGRFVGDCERAISTENEAWLAEWTSEKGEK
jgi:hypothetical protein